MDPIEFPRLRSWWADDSADQGRLSRHDPAVVQLLAEIDPSARVSDLGGTMSLNLHLESSGLVLRVHQPFVSQQRVAALQRVRRFLGDKGLVVPAPVSHAGANSFHCSGRWAELETYVPQQKRDPNMDSYRWLFSAMGRLHGTLATLDIATPRPMISTYAPPGSLRRWLSVTADVVVHERDESVHPVRKQVISLLSSLERQWIPASRLPNQFVHGDVRLANVRIDPAGDTVYLDFGFLAMRPRVHDIAYALMFVLLTSFAQDCPSEFNWDIIPDLIVAYQSTAPSPLSQIERQALTPYVASLLLYPLAVAGFSSRPDSQISSEKFRLPLSEWLLRHPNTLQVR